ncbi:MAG: hypothetical protein ABIR71_01065 [Chthoniobacterales bacterium]
MRTTDGAFVRDQKFFAQERNGEAVEFGGDWAGKSFVRGDSSDAGKKIDPIGRTPQLNDSIGRGEVGDGDSQVAEPELL